MTAHTKIVTLSESDTSQVLSTHYTSQSTGLTGMHRSLIPVLYTYHITLRSLLQDYCLLNQLVNTMTTSMGCHMDIVHMVVEFNSLYDARGLGVQTVWTKRLQQAKVSCRVITFRRHDIIECYYLCIYETCCIISSCSYVTFCTI